MSSSKKRRASALDEIIALKAQRRMDVLKCLVALVLIVALLYGKQLLEINGILSPDNIGSGAVMMVGSIGLAILGGTASIDFTKSGNIIRELRSTNHITDEDIKNYSSEE